MLVSRWQSAETGPRRAVILPDGCRDVILVMRDGEVMRVFQTDLDWQPRDFVSDGGDHLIGYRMRPGMWVDERDLQDLVLGGDFDADLIPDLARGSQDMADVIEALIGSDTLEQAARQLGVSPRSLQRHFARQGLPKPEFWRMLGRSRLAALDLGSGPGLAEIAADHGFSDQAHMSRHFKRWFGMTPGRLRASPDRLAMIGAAGLGNWG